LAYTTKLAFLPVQVVAGAIGTVIFPLIAGQFASLNRAGIRYSMSLALRMVSFIVIPCAVGLSVLAYPIVQTLFERGAFGPAATALCANLIPFACVPLIALSYNELLSRACYACRGVRLSVAGSIIAIAINVVLSATWLPTLGARGLLLANGISGLLLAAFEIALLWRLVGGFEWKLLLTSVLRVSFASLVMAGVLYWIHSLGFVPAGTLASRASCLAELLAIAASIFLCFARLLGVEELTIAARTFKQRFARGAVTPPESMGGPIG
jgi:putative peptidoglycan lipid II flippase